MKLNIKKIFLIGALSLQNSSSSNLNSLEFQFLKREKPIKVELVEEPGRVSRNVLLKRLCGHSIVSVLPIIRKFGSNSNTEIAVQTESFDINNKPILKVGFLNISGGGSLSWLHSCYENTPYLTHTLHTHPDNLSESSSDMEFIVEHTQLIEKRKKFFMLVFLDNLIFILTHKSIFFEKKP